MKNTDYKSIIDNHIQSLSQFSLRLTRYPNGINRLAFTPSETQAIEWARSQLEGFGYCCEYDSFLNLHARHPKPGKERALVGTHLDSVLNAGRYDGTVGLVTFLLCLQMASNEKAEFNLPVDFIVFRAEESTVFKEALLGSKVATGVFDLEDLEKKVYKRDEDIDPVYERLYEDSPDLELNQQWTVVDLILAQKLKKVNLSDIKKGCWLFNDADGKSLRNYKAYFEVHIEQGKVLEINEKKIGLVTSIRAPLRYIITLKGKRDHSGATPMGKEYRRDVLCAASECILKTENLCEGESLLGVDIVGTIGVFNIPGMGINVIPGECNMTLDLRSNDADERERIFNNIKKEMEFRCSRRNVKVTFDKVEDSKPVDLLSNSQPGFFKTIGERIREVKYEYMSLPSGAGHDAMRMAQVGIAVCLLFIPCKDGISHSPQEFASNDDILAGAKVLKSILVKGFD